MYLYLLYIDYDTDSYNLLRRLFPGLFTSIHSKWRWWENLATDGIRNHDFWIWSPVFYPWTAVPDKISIHICTHKMLFHFLQKVTIKDEDWTRSLADYIRNNDKILLESCDKLLAAYQDEMLPCESFAEFADVMGTFQENLSYSVDSAVTHIKRLIF